MENQVSGENNGQRHILRPQHDETAGTQFFMKQEEASTSILNQVSISSLSHGLKPEIRYRSSPVQTNLTISLAPSPPSKSPNFYRFDERDMSKSISSFHQGSKSRHLLPRAPKSVIVGDANIANTVASQIRIARPPVEGRVKNQLLPRYWPRITEQELQQISGDSNSTVVPLFEKVLSASDAGRIGRLVLPKACAEAYFPPISQPEGLPLRIQDVKGKEWVFQFRFWPNNNSRMYVLEGVTPCIQSMQLQAGDTVTFSRMDPEGKLLMGFRKASNNNALQETHFVTNPMQNTGFSSERFFAPGVVENLPIMSGYSGLFQSLKGSPDPIMLTQSAERKRSRNIGSKSKRLLIENQDALELKLTWEELQDMLRPPPVKPSTIIIEDHEFEEYEDPPVLGKGSIFTARMSGVQEQWAPCDNCCKWRRLPADFLLPPTWTCQDNIWDQSRCSCSAPDELSPGELEILLKMNKEHKKRRISSSEKHESANVDMTMSEVEVGGGGSTSSVAAATTRHPRHRPGCSCIVCIQPPSGKGKHKPTCTCNVCMTVKRRFKTLMMRKKKRQSDREAEFAAQAQIQVHTQLQTHHHHQFLWSVPKRKEDETELDNASKLCMAENVELQQHQHQQQQTNDGGELDLNSSHPPDRVSMMSLFKVANLPLETYLKQNGLTSLVSDQPTAESEGPLEEKSRGDDHDDDDIDDDNDAEENVEPDKSQNSPS
jgi:hypothetical protein